MSAPDVDQLIRRIERLPDSDVIKALATPGEYSLEAMAVYESEGQRRGIRPETVRPVALLEAQRRKDALAVARNFKGIGEKIHGMRAFRPDGSYQVTKWSIFLFVPLYPIATFRLKSDEKGRISVVEVLPVDWRQAGDTYGFLLVAVAGLSACFQLLERYSGPYSSWINIVPSSCRSYFCISCAAGRGESRRDETGGKSPVLPSESTSGKK